MITEDTSCTTMMCNGGGRGIRTPNPRYQKPMHYQLCYTAIYKSVGSSSNLHLTAALKGAVMLTQTTIYQILLNGTRINGSTDDRAPTDLSDIIYNCLSLMGK